MNCRLRSAFRSRIVQVDQPETAPAACTVPSTIIVAPNLRGLLDRRDGARGLRLSGNHAHASQLEQPGRQCFDDAIASMPEAADRRGHGTGEPPRTEVRMRASARQWPPARWCGWSRHGQRRTTASPTEMRQPAPMRSAPGAAASPLTVPKAFEAGPISWRCGGAISR